MTVLVLDCDGVVLTGHPDGGRWDKHLARDFGIEAAALQERFFKPHWKAIAHGETDMREVLARVWPELGSAASADAFVDYWFSNDATVDNDVLEQVDAWRAGGGKAYLATVQEHHRARYLRDTLGLGRHFDAIHYSAALGATKPDATFYERVQTKLPIAVPSDVIFLDDQVRNVDAANAHGWRATHFRSADDLRAALRASDSGSG